MLRLHHLGHRLEHGRAVQLQGAASTPTFVLLCEVQLHEVPSHRGEQHVHCLPIELVGELPDGVVGRAVGIVERRCQPELRPCSLDSKKDATAAPHHERLCLAPPLLSRRDTSLATLGFSATLRTLMVIY